MLACQHFDVVPPFVVFFWCAGEEGGNLPQFFQQGGLHQLFRQDVEGVSRVGIQPGKERLMC